MKITVSKNEIVQMFNEKFNLNIGEDDLVITGQNLRSNYIESIFRVQREFPNWKTNQKIDAIKRFRELTGVGLVVAKYTVEEPEKAIEHFVGCNQPYSGPNFPNNY